MELYKFELRRVKLNRDGYTSSGQYFGHGAPLYEYCGDVEMTGIEGEPTVRLHCDHVRAYSRDDAKALLRAKFPEARFYR